MSIVLSDGDGGCPFPDLVNTHWMGIIYHLSSERLFYMSISGDGKFNRVLFGRTGFERVQIEIG
jgi:hypothetical protein